MNFEEIETTKYGAIIVDEYVIDTASRILLNDLCVVLLGEVCKVLVTAVRNGSGKVRAIRGFEGQDRLSVIVSETLQFRHAPIVISHR